MNKLLILLLCFNCFAEDASFLAKDKPAPYDGILFTTDKAQTIKQKLVERDTYEALNTSLNKSLNLSNDIISNQQTKLDVINNQNDKLAKELYSERQFTNLERGLWFLGGIVVTGVAAWSLHNIIK